MDSKLGLFRLVPFEEAERMKSELSLIYEDVYDSLECARDNVRDLEQTLDRIFYGESYGKSIGECRSKRRPAD